VLLLALDLVGDGKVVHGMAAQVEGIEVAGGVFGGGDPGGGIFGFGGGHGARDRFVMAGGGDEMSVSGVDVEVIKGFVEGEGVGHVAAQTAADPTENLVQEFETTRAFEAFEKGGDEDRCVVQVGGLLQEITPTLEDAETAPDTGFEPEGIVERGTVPAVYCGIKNLEKRLEEFRTDD